MLSSELDPHSFSKRKQENRLKDSSCIEDYENQQLQLPHIREVKVLKPTKMKSPSFSQFSGCLSLSSS